MRRRTVSQNVQQARYTVLPVDGLGRQDQVVLNVVPLQAGCETFPRTIRKLEPDLVFLQPGLEDFDDLGTDIEVVLFLIKVRGRDRGQYQVRKRH